MYNAWCDSIISQAEEVLEEFWESGWSMNDVQPRNFILTPTNSISMIDLECARPLSRAGDEELIHTVEFTPDAQTFGVTRDKNGLEAMRLWLSLGFVPPITGKAVRFLRSVCTDLLNVSPRLAETFDHLESVGESNDVRSSGVSARGSAGFESFEIQEIDEERESVASSSAALEKAAEEALISGITERKNDLPAETRLDFWSGVAGAVPLVGVRLGGDASAHRSLPFPWKDGNFTNFVSETSDSRMLDATLSSYALAAALSGAPFQWQDWAASVSRVVELGETNRGLYSGLAGILITCNRLAAAGVTEIKSLAELTYERMLANPEGDVDWTFLTGRTGTSLALLAAHEIFGIGQRSDAIDLLRSAADAARLDPEAPYRGGLQGWPGFVAACRAAVRDDDEFQSLELPVPRIDVWAKLRHRSLGLDGIGGTMIAARTLLDHDDWLQGPLVLQAWRRMSIIFSGDRAFDAASDPRVNYGLYSGVAGLLAGTRLGKDFWTDWMSLDRS